MKKEIVGIVICMPLITTVLPVAGTMNVDREIGVLFDLTQDINIMVNLTSVNMQYENEDLFCDPKDEYIDQIQTQHGGTGYNINYDQFVAQSFTPSVKSLSKVDLMLFRYGGVPKYKLIFYVREILTGNNLATVTKVGSEVINGWNEFDFADLEVVINKTYYLVCEGDGGTGSDPYYCWYYSNTNPYNRGMTYIFNYGKWHNVPNSDCCFITYYTLEETNEPPDKPGINGTTNGKVGVSYVYSAITIDPEEDQIWYWFDWGDNTSTGWAGPYPSGTIASESHIWSAEGTYHIKVKAKDSVDAESLWGTLEVTIPRARTVYHLLLQLFFERFPLLERLILSH